jgi:serine phosphatase RsbU (regulator of sigma subunit)/anti-sigma regulatory factor (Ser/Thr protein kinase)
MAEGWGAVTSQELLQLRRLTTALGAALTVDDVARAALTSALRIAGVIRAGLALKYTGGRQLQFFSTDQDALDPSRLRWCLIDAYDHVPVVTAVRQGAEVFLQTVAELEERFPEIAERQKQLGTRSLVSLPLSTDEEEIGALLISFRHERYFSSQDRWFLSSFAAQITQAVRRGLAFQIQSTTSEQLQRSLMPHSLPEVDGVSLGAHYQPGGINVDVGGDWYDVLELDDGSVMFALGDVMGKGVPAAIVMSEIRSALRAYAILDPTPSVVMSRLDQLVTKLAVAEQIVTVVCGVLAADRRTVTYAAAGHPPPLLVPPSGPPEVLRDNIGPALGLGIGPWPEVRLDLPADATMLLYSDGLVETREVDLFAGIERLAERVAALPRRRRNAREMCTRVSELMYHHDADDDVTVLAVSATAQAATLSASLELPGDPTASGRARRFLRSTLAEWSVHEDVVDTAELCVSELVTNAIIHSGTAPEVTARSDGELLTVLVQDRGGQGQVQQEEDYDPMSISGRGLTLVDALASAWSAEHSADGTTVWFELELTPSSVQHQAG